MSRELLPLHVVFDGPPSHDGPRFIEVETPDGKSINAGEWRERPDGYWELVIGAEPVKSPLAHEIEQSAIAAIAALSTPFVPTEGQEGAVVGDWIEWKGGENPVPGRMVDTRFRGFTIDDQINDRSETWAWTHSCGANDIIAYRLAPPTDAKREERE